MLAARRALVALVFAVAIPLPARAQAVGQEFQVNASTSGVQTTGIGGGSHAVAMDALGNFVVVWQDALSIKGQSFDAAGVPIGGEFQVSASGSAYYGNVGMQPSGEFIVTWSAFSAAGTDSSLTSIQARRFDAAGSPIGGEFQVNTSTTGYQRDSQVVIDSSGGFVIAWASDASAGSDQSQSSIQMRRYDASGNPLTGEVQVNSYTSGIQDLPAIGMDANGNFTIVWEGYGSTGNDNDALSIHGQRYDAAGNPIGAEIQVNTFTSGFQSTPSLAMRGTGSFVVAWYSDGSAGTDNQQTSIQARRFSAAGNPLGADFQVNSYTTNGQYQPSVAMDAAGDFVVAWSGLGSPGNDPDRSIKARRFSAAGSALGADFQVNSYTSGTVLFAQVAGGGAGRFVTVWTSRGQDAPDNGNVFGRLLGGLAIDDVSLSEGDSGTTNAVFTVTLLKASTQTVTVHYATANGTAMAGSDYTSKSGTLTFAPGVTTKTVKVSVTGETRYEPDETFYVDLTAATNAKISKPRGVGKILNDDPSPTISIADPVALTEGDSGTTNMTFTVSLSNASYQTVTVVYATADDSATAPFDYTAKLPTTLTFTPGMVAATFNVKVKGDLVPESMEQFFVHLSSPSHAAIGDGQAIGTILDNDP